MIENLPTPLRTLLATSQHPVDTEPNIKSLKPLWRKHVEHARMLVPEIQVEADGEALYLGELSPGCRACKDGLWDCVFVTTHCNIDCPFCCSPQSIPAIYQGSAFGVTPEEILAGHEQTRITGISFSGGEPFTQPQKLLEWFSTFKLQHPDKYYWVYTNGLLAHQEHLQQLGELGLDEIRFNTAATGYTHRTVMRNLAWAARYIPCVTIEIPAIPSQAHKLLSSLEAWCDLGVKHLNLHELMYEPGTNAASLPGPRRLVVTEDGHTTETDPESRALTLAVMAKVNEEKLPIAVNDCSMQSKLRQVRGRRRSLRPLTQAPYEKAVGDQGLETICLCNEEQLVFCHPDASLPEEVLNYRVFRLIRNAPLSRAEPNQWIAVEELPCG